MKIELMNYRTYEYKLLQDKLNELGKQGYDCDDLNLISFFKKKDHPVYYKVEFYQSKEKEKYKQHKDIAKYYEQHTNYGFYPIYAKSGMYVFAGNEDYDFKYNEYKNSVELANKRTSNCFLIGCILAAVTLFLYYVMFATQDVTAFLSYGKPIAYIGVLLLAANITSRFFNEFKYTDQFKNGELPDQKIAQIHKIQTIIFIICYTLIFGGLIEDTVNAKEVTVNDHPYIQLSDLGYDITTESAATQKHGFIIKESISTYETSDEYGLSTKEYTFRNESSAIDYIEYLIEYPYVAISTEIKQQDNLYYGYYEDTLNTIIIKKDTTVIIVTCSEPLTDEHVNTIKDFYN